jgi:hypothetical protein
LNNSTNIRKPIIFAKQNRKIMQEISENKVAVFFKLPLGARERLKQAAEKASQERGYNVSMTQLLLEFIQSL